MAKFITGVIVGILLFFLFVYFGGGRTLKKVGVGFIESGKKMEVMEEIIRKKKGESEKEAERDIKKRVFKQDKEAAQTEAPR